jgi:uncharacterized membrane protein YgcG
MLVEVDQCDPANLMAVENRCRRQVQLDLAVERNPTHPDFTGLSEMMAAPTTDYGSIAVSNFRSWIGDRQRDRANVMKQARMEREELDTTRRRRDGGGGGYGPRGGEGGGGSGSGGGGGAAGPAAVQK